MTKVQKEEQRLADLIITSLEADKEGNEMTKNAMLKFMVDMGRYSVMVSDVRNDEGCTEEEARRKVVGYLAKGLTKQEVYELYSGCVSECLWW